MERNMAGASLLALLDDIATVLDDVAILSKVAVKKTAGVLGDDLALNAEQVAGVKAEREIPVIISVAKGSFKNKFILVPAALFISALAPWLITPLLMLGGAFLCYEGCEKVLHSLTHKKEAYDAATILEQSKIENIDSNEDLQALENEKVKGAIRTDFILSAEIIVIALGAVQSAPFITQVAVVSFVAIMITFFVYGLVALIVRMDDAGLYLLKLKGVGLGIKLKHVIGAFLLSFAPKLMRALTYIGTVAMFLVGGSIIVHGIELLSHISHLIENYANDQQGVEGLVLIVLPSLFAGIVGIVLGAVLLIIHHLMMLIKGINK
jgi:predicted DNA repair protein MutK